MNVAIIPARGGSKRIPRKNIRSFAGLPMVAHSIRCALGSGLFDRVIVSTDDSEIAALALQYGAEVPFVRPTALADDLTATAAVIAHALSWFAVQSVDVDCACCIYATAPFLRAEDLERGLVLLRSGLWRYVFAATSYEFPVYRSFRQEPSGGVGMLFPEHYESRSQDLPEVMHDAGQFYWATPETWAHSPKIFEEGSTIVRIPRWRAQDIDTEEDWARAEAMADYAARSNII